MKVPISMKMYVFLFLLLNFSFSYAQSTFEFEHDGQSRNYILYTPDNLPDNAPLVFVLHGYTSSANNIMAYSEMNQEALKNNFAVCYPQGLGDNFGIPHWNANLTISSVDDIGFLSELAEYLHLENNLDPSRTFACGMSNGGFMSYTLACEASGVFSAIASVTGTMSGYDWENCDPEKVIPIMQISGSADATVPINGSMTTFGGWGGAPGMEAVKDFWVSLNECLPKSTIIVDNFNYSSEFRVYDRGVNDNEVWNYLIEGWGHSWPVTASNIGFTASAEIWKFFSLIEGDAPTSLSDFSDTSDDINIYPVPASSFLTIEEKSVGNSEYQLYSLNGQKLAHGNFSGIEEIDISYLEEGMYILNVNQKNYKVSIFR